MSAIRPRRLGNQWSIHSDLTGNTGQVDTFQTLQPVTISSVVSGGTQITLNISDPNAGADTSFYTHVVQRSVDGSAFTTLWENETGFISSTLEDIIFFAVDPVVTMADGVQVTLPGVAYLTLPAIPNFNPLTGEKKAPLLLDTMALRSDGHSLILPTGTIVTFPAGTSLVNGFVPNGHAYAYKVAVKNKFMTTALSASNSATVASAFTAQVMNVPTRVNNVVTLTWSDTNSYSLGNKIEVWKDVGGFGYSLLATIVKTAAAMPTTYQDSFDFLTLVPATYSYKIRSFKPAPLDTGPFSNSQSLVVNFTLSQITALTATPSGGDTQIDLAWTDPNLPANEAGVYVDRAIGLVGQFQRIATLAPGAVAYSDVFQTVPGQTYQYRVTPFNALHPGPASATASATTGLLVPSVYEVDQLADVGATVFWTDANEHATGYTVQRSVNGGAFSTVATTGAADRRFDDNVTLVIGDAISYKVRAFNAAVTSAFSNTKSLTIGYILVQPTNVVATFVRDGLVNVTWTGNNSGNRGVLIQRSVNGGGFNQIASLPKDQRSYNDVLQTISGQAYTYLINDFNNQQVGPLSAFAVTSSVLDAPISLQIVATTPPNGVTLQWTAFTQPQGTNEDYVVVERAFGTGSFSEIARVPYGSSIHRASTAGGVPGDIVSFRVRKVKEPYTIYGTVTVPINLGDYSVVVSNASALSVPTSVIVTRNQAGVNNVAWSDTNTLATGFKVFRQITAGGIASPLIQIATLSSAAARSYDDVVDAAPGQTFTYSVMAFSATTSSVYSGFGSLTTRFVAPRLELFQNSRTVIDISWATNGISGIAGDKLQLLKTLNGGTPTVIATLNQPFFGGVLYSDNTVSVGQEVSYSARFFSTTELGPSSVPVLMTVGDIVNTPIGSIRQLRIHGSRTKFVQRDVLAVGAGGISKVSDSAGTPVVTSNTDPQLSDAYSGIAGDQTRFVVFTGTTPGSGWSLVVDANNLAIVSSQPTGFVDTMGYGAIVVQQAQIDYYADLESAAYTDGSTGEYTGWGFLRLTPTINMNPNFPLRLGPWESNLSSVDLGVMTQTLTQGTNYMIATQLDVNSILPRRLENLSGDCVFCTNPTGTFTTVNRAQRGSFTYEKMADIPARVMDIVSDSISKVLAVTIRGEIYLIDAQFNPTNPTIGLIGKLPLTPVNQAGDLIDPTTDFISIELMASRKIAVAVGTRTNVQNLNFNFQSVSHVYVFDVPGILAAGANLKLAKTIDCPEKIRQIAFDGGKYLYAVSNDTQYRLIRFDAGF